MKIRCNATILAVLSFLAVPAMAEDREGAYVYVSAAQAYARNACASPALPAGQSCTQSSLAIRAGYGYQFTSMWGLELNGGQFAGANSDGYSTFAAPVGAANYSWQLKATGLAVQGVATLHMGDVLSVFGKFGLARVEYVESMTAANGTFVFNPTATTNRSVPALGAGVQLDVTPHGSLRFMVESFGSSDVYRNGGSTTRVRLVSGSVALMYRY